MLGRQVIVCVSGAGKCLAAQPTEVRTTPARHVVAAVALLDGSVALGARLGVPSLPCIKLWLPAAALRPVLCARAPLMPWLLALCAPAAQAAVTGVQRHALPVHLGAVRTGAGAVLLGVALRVAPQGGGVCCTHLCGGEERAKVTQ
eukprot:CAMPEP_0202913858 /NCGR_PEP_ID=MMETSP1392-20130828/61627_1 /ASSEMBLY_ACC=CAM_ASM_000868 /TAXON_ID=225041 /ORGANISM="Chlamydomonas chlamydogama, Strain SAG 11-48b" /LENGTH=145 /DNA_ID=CAMNT_0049605283 /DNA_START=338 /DNA_END=775 /DNA_ORIENTATION=+